MVKMPVYLVRDAHLDLFVTTPEDLVDGNMIRPDAKFCVPMNFSDFLERESRA